MKYFISCDWGTTRFRLRLVEAENLAVVKEIADTSGAAHLSSCFSDTERSQAFANHLRQAVENLLESGKVPVSICIVSGMATSSIGWIELPYASVPQPLDGTGFIRREIRLALANGLNLRTLLVSGIKTSDDVMRGEETQLAGLAFLHPEWIQKESILIVMPGTHSKHVELRQGSIHDFETVMTGELFSHLPAAPTLQALFKSETGDIDRSAFNEGLCQARTKGALASLFKIRARCLLGTLARKNLRSYLSGLLIGDELQQLSRQFSGEIKIAAEPPLESLYNWASETLGISRISMVSPATMRRALLAGHRLLARGEVPHEEI